MTMANAGKPNAQYNVAQPDSLPVRMAARARKRMYEHFLNRAAPLPAETLLDVGVTADESYEASNYLEAWYPHKHRITAVGLDDASFLERRYPGVRYRQADGRQLPFESNSFDVVHSSAVLEHVGTRAEQQQFIGELARVARRVVFLTTPNRWFPVEFHSLLPLVHWLPPATFRAILRGTRYEFFSHEENLNLLSSSQLLRLCESAQGCSVVVESLRLFGLASNLMATLRKSVSEVSQ